MAKITYGPIVSEGRGKVGDIVLNRNRGGNFARALKLTPAGAAAGDGCSLYTTEVITIPDSVPLYVPFDAEDYDVGDLHSNTVNPTRVTITKGGLYLVVINPWVDFTTPGSLQIFLYKNAAPLPFQHQTPTTLNDAASTSCSALLLLSAADFLELYLFQESGDDAFLATHPDYPSALAVQQLTST